MAKLRARGKDADALLSGPMLGYSELTETVVWLQTRRPARVQVRYWKKDEPNRAHLSEEIRTAGDTDHIARFTLTGLAFGSTYTYEIFIDGDRIERPYDMTFRTQPMWRHRTDPPDFKVAFGSCAYIPDAPFDAEKSPKPGTAENPWIFPLIADQNPDLMLWLGDNCYYREADWLTEAGMRYRYAHTRAHPSLQPLWAKTHHYATWDDHDYGPNDSDRAFRGREATLKVFKDYWANPSYGTEKTPGVFGRFLWGDVEFFMLDDRYYRTPDGFADDHPAKTMFGEDQFHWLTQALRESTAPFKIIANGNQMLNDLNGYEGLNRCRVEQKRLFEFIRDEAITGVVFISGDRHFSELIRKDFPGTYPLYDYTSSSLASGLPKPDKELDNPQRLPGTLVYGRHNFGLLEFTGPRKERVLTMKCIDVDGKERFRHVIKASELTFPKTPSR